MPDIEKVVALLERYVDSPNLAGAENYGAKIVDMPAPLITDALALLKAQEPVKPNAIMHGKMVMYYQCPACLATIDNGNKFCPNCGRPVKWE